MKNGQLRAAILVTFVLLTCCTSQQVKVAEPDRGKSNARIPAFWPFAGDDPNEKLSKIDSFTATTLSTMVGDSPDPREDHSHGILKDEPYGLLGEWGYSTLVKVESRGNTYRILFDTGRAGGLIVYNAIKLGLKDELCQTKVVVLSHSHIDHTGGLLAARQWAKENCLNPDGSEMKALSIAYVGDGFDRTDGYLPSKGALNSPIPVPVLGDNPIKFNYTQKTAKPYQDENEYIHKYLIPGYEKKLGGQFRHLKKGQEIFEGTGIWLTGPIRAQSADALNYHPDEGQGKVVDDQSMVLVTRHGLVIVSGCGHAGIGNILNYVRNVLFENPKIIGMMGGWHLLYMKLSDVRGRVADLLKDAGGKSFYFLASHCTGFDTFFALREEMGWDRKKAVIDSVSTQMIYKHDDAEPLKIIAGDINTPPED